MFWPYFGYVIYTLYSLYHLLIWYVTFACIYLFIIYLDIITMGIFLMDSLGEYAALYFALLFQKYFKLFSSTHIFDASILEIPFFIHSRW